MILCTNVCVCATWGFYPTQRNRKTVRDGGKKGKEEKKERIGVGFFEAGRREEGGKEEGGRRRGEGA